MNPQKGLALPMVGYSTEETLEEGFLLINHFSISPLGSCCLEGRSRACVCPAAPPSTAAPTIGHQHWVKAASRTV